MRYKQKYIHGYDSFTKSKQWNVVGDIWSINFWYIQPSKTVAEAYCNIDKRYVLGDLRVVWKDYKIVKSVDQCCIFLYHRYFEGMELYAVDQWVNFITEVLYTKYFPIKNTLIKFYNKHKFHSKRKKILALCQKQPFWKIQI